MKLCVYYRCAATALDETVAVARAMQTALAGLHPGLGSELLRRPEARDGEFTLMEVYDGEPVGEAFEAELARAARQVALPHPRHVERFIAAD
ncbi:MAG: DUF4936 family protein [Burkholderiaceae bacterium]|nr:DUF4936 family protein [Burkholderiaceae bacterium]